MFVISKFVYNVWFVAVRLNACIFVIRFDAMFVMLQHFLIHSMFDIVAVHFDKMFVLLQ